MAMVIDVSASIQQYARPPSRFYDEQAYFRLAPGESPAR
jgi:hypothetical protein